jgi:hypothetical protein
MFLIRRFLLILIFILVFQINGLTEEESQFPVPKIPFNPNTYLCLKAESAIVINGVADEITWQNAEWTSYFVDIEGNLKPEPTFKTRVKMLWDDQCFYVYAEIEEPLIWATLTKRDSVIYYDNDFEVFIDPDDDTHLYYELEMNALNTVWDLFLVKPYRDGGPAIDAWDIQGLQTAVKIDGTINNSSDTDKGWSVEIAIPWDVLRQAAGTECPPSDGDRWRVNFSRVEWQVEIQDGKYQKRINPDTGKSYPEDNWVWSPQGLINMHYPEMWGIVEFSTESINTSRRKVGLTNNDYARWSLRQVYYAERDFYEKNGTFTCDWEKLNLNLEKLKNWSYPPEIRAPLERFEAIITRSDGKTMSITEDGKIHWKGDQ